MANSVPALLAVALLVAISSLQGRGGAQLVGPGLPTRSCTRNRVIELAG